MDGSPSIIAGHDRLIDVRVDDHHDPLGELRRLIGAQPSSTAAMGDADEALATRRPRRRRSRSTPTRWPTCPQHHEIPFWHAVVLAGLGRDDEARAAAAPVFARADGERWRELVRRLPATGLLPDDAAERLLDG